MDANWREIYRTDELSDARAVATSIASMEFDARLLTGAGEEDDPSGNPQDAGPPPYIIMVRDDDHADLVGVIDEIVEEQIEFDEHVAAKRRRPAILNAVLLVRRLFRFLWR